MKLIRMAPSFAALALLAACASAPAEYVTRGDTSDHFHLVSMGGEVSAAASRSYKVTGVEVVVPDTLVVSEENSYKPRADIVWREDPLGDRRAQVDALMTDALMRGVAGTDGAREVTLVVTLTKFHALTELTRYSAPFGATHDLQMTLTVLDAATGDVIEAARPIGFEIEAHTRQAAIDDAAAGITQRSRISDALVLMIRDELGIPASGPVVAAAN